LIPIGVQHGIYHLDAMLNLRNRLVEQKFGPGKLELMKFCELQAGKYELTSLSIPAHFREYCFNAALYKNYTDVWDAVKHLHDILNSGAFNEELYREHNVVT